MVSVLVFHIPGSQTINHHNVLRGRRDSAPGTIPPKGTYRNQLPGLRRRRRHGGPAPAMTALEFAPTPG